MELKKSIINRVAIVVLITWVASLLAVYLPISNLVSLTYQVIINNSIMAIFVVSSGLAFFMSLYLGLDKLRSNP